MLKPAQLRNLVHALLLLIDKALKDGYERASLKTAILFGVLSQRTVAKNNGCSHQTVGRITRKLLAMATPLPDFMALDSDALMLLFYPSYKKRNSKKRRPPFDLLLAELKINPKKLRLKIIVIYLAYRAEDPATALSYSQFCALWAEYRKSSKLEMRFEYAPGEVMFCDFAGVIVGYKDKKTGKTVKLYAFVAVLGYSKKMFVYLTPDLTAKSWIEGLVQAFNFYGGTPVVVHFDNAALVKKAGLLPELNEHVKVLSRYFNVICDTSRVSTPRDNANGEKTVQYTENRVLVPLRRITVYSREEAQAFVYKEVDTLNNEPMQKTKVSREQVFKEEEKPALNTLPTHPYEPYDARFLQKSSASHTVEYDQHEYSVPEDKRNKYLTVEVKGDRLQVIDDHEVIATHTISRVKGGMTILDSHRPANHLAEDKKNQIEFSKWAEAIGDSTLAIVMKQYEGMKSPRSRPAGKRCLVLKRLEKQFGSTRLEKACEYALEQCMHSVDDIRLIIKSGIFEDNDDLPSMPPVINHTNVRGKSYYEGYHHE